MRPQQHRNPFQAPSPGERRGERRRRVEPSGRCLLGCPGEDGKAHGQPGCEGLEGHSLACQSEEEPAAGREGDNCKQPVSSHACSVARPPPTPCPVPTGARALLASSSRSRGTCSCSHTACCSWCSGSHSSGSTRTRRSRTGSWSRSSFLSCRCTRYLGKRSTCRRSSRTDNRLTDSSSRDNYSDRTPGSCSRKRRWRRARRGRQPSPPRPGPRRPRPPLSRPSAGLGGDSACEPCPRLRPSE
jgi:hypothetical protein